MVIGLSQAGTGCAAPAHLLRRVVAHDGQQLAILVGPAGNLAPQLIIWAALRAHVRQPEHKQLALSYEVCQKAGQ